MFSSRFRLGRRQTARGARDLVDRRFGSRASRRPDPMPRLRWYA